MTDDVFHSEPNTALWMAVAVTLVPRVPSGVGQPPAAFAFAR